MATDTALLQKRVREAVQQLQRSGIVAPAAQMLAERLRNTYPEYSRVKLVPFRHQVSEQLTTLGMTPPEPDTSSKEATSSTKQLDSKADLARLKMARQRVAADVGQSKEARNLDDQIGKDFARKKRRRETSGQSQGRGDDGNSGGLNVEPFVPTCTLADMGGIDEIMVEVNELCVFPLRHPEVFKHLGVKPPCGIMLHGPPGCGKTMLANCIAGSAQCAFFKISAPEIVSGMSGESEAKLRELFDEAKMQQPAIIFLDEIDVITPKRENASKDMERRIVAQLLTCMDELAGNAVMVLGATNRVDSLDSALRRAGRFDRELSLGIPDEHARARMLKVMTKDMRTGPDVNFKVLAGQTSGFVGADLTAVAQEAALATLRRVGDGVDPMQPTFTQEQLDPMYVEMVDFEAAIPKVQPSAKREGFTTVPDVTWEDVGALSKLRREMELAICAPIKNAAVYKTLGLEAPAGCLLFGPPGVGKTLLAKAVANQSGASFISVKGPELLNKYVGESERAVRQVFARAQASSPCIVFFDEIDALCPKRSSDGSSSSERVVNQLLTELDGMSTRRNVFVVAATNRPDIIDPAMLRPGRLDQLLYVPLPDLVCRLLLVKKICTHSFKSFRLPQKMTLPLHHFLYYLK